MDTQEKPAHARAVCLAFMVSGAISLAVGVPGLLVAAFSGPHILVAAIGLIVIGLASIAVGLGILAGSQMARNGGIVIAAIVTALSSFAIVSTLANDTADWPAAFFWAAATAPVTTAGGTLLRTELGRRRPVSNVQSDSPPGGRSR